MKNIIISEIANLPTKYGKFKIQSFQEKLENDIKEHLVIFTQNLCDTPVVRIHSECLTGDALGSLKCDCGEQLAYALEYINRHNGMIIYHRQEGRNIGLLNKVNAYALQDKGLDTIQANHQLGFKADERNYEIIEFILEKFKIDKIRLLTNNPSKISSLKSVEIVERVEIKMQENIFNKDYLAVKKSGMGHLL
ncbi:GTP cyclohydrolase II [hydrothermal vent metagenome]|uniref:GTP cyclohydrolase II n=1 Tax=hydrothermal vent metagenome TaxID=652676 RepID=A0A1W1EKL8_9ZZZZ